MKTVILTTLVVTAGVLFAPAAHADVTVCDYLDAHPNAAGVQDVVVMAVYGNGMTPEQAAEFIWDEIVSYCPRHLITLEIAMDQAGYGQAHKKMRV